MKRFACLIVCLGLLLSSTGCCLFGPCCGGYGAGYGGGCGPGGCGYGTGYGPTYSPYGATGPTGYLGGPVTAGVPYYPTVTAGVPLQALPQ